MTQGTNLVLISVLERAGEGSRELDLMIAPLDGWTKSPIGFGNTGWRKEGNSSSEIPHYTTSLDAALTLVPEGWTVANLWSSAFRQDGTWWAADLRRGYYKDESGYRCETAKGAKTLPLAICIAALKARVKP